MSRSFVAAILALTYVVAAPHSASAASVEVKEATFAGIVDFRRPEPPIGGVGSKDIDTPHYGGPAAADGCKKDEVRNTDMHA